MKSLTAGLAQRHAKGVMTTLLVALGLLVLAFAADSMVTALATASPAGDHASITGSNVAIYNLAGEARLEAGSGSAVQVTVNRGGADGDRLDLEQGPIGGRSTLRVVYPSNRIVYPKMGRFSNTTVHVRDDGTFGGKEGSWFGGSVKVSGSGSGTEAWADLVVSVPRGQKLSLYLAVGAVTVTNVDGELMVDTGSGNVSATGTRGRLSVDTGSGEVNVGNAGGTLAIDTGSGDVNVSGLEGDELNVDTGSGGIRARNVHAGTIALDTGSGDVEGASLAASKIAVDTGSGSVDLGLNSMAQSISVDTGSGDVTLRVPKTAGGEVSFETGSGGFDYEDLPVQLRKLEHGSYRGRFGDGSARVVIETGSGDFRLASNAPRK